MYQYLILIIGCDSVVTLDLTITNINSSTSLSNQTITATQSGALYQWLNCDSAFAIVPGATGQSFTAPANGNYAVQITDNNCIDTSICVAITTLAIKTMEDGQQVKLYPNPTTEQVNIDFETEQKRIVLKIFDTAGRLLLQQNFDNTKQIILSLPYVSGVYLIQLETEKGQAVFPVVKE